MLLRDMLEQIGTTYDRGLGTSNDVPAQLLLRTESTEVLKRLLPLGYTSEGSGGRGTPAETPWIAVFDSDETDTARKGTYLVYLFAIENRTVSLTLNQGVTELQKQHGIAKARSILAEQADTMRNSVRPTSTSDLEHEISLGGERDPAKSYEAGNVFATTYPIDDLPSESELVAHLDRFIALYAHVLELRDVSQPQPQVHSDSTAPVKHLPKFKPKDDSDVKRIIRAQEQIVSRKHETLVAAYGKYLEDQHFNVATEVHPRDMTAEGGDKHWLIEAKTVGNNPIQATRDALSQLYFYRHFEYLNSSSVHCVALFNEPIGESLVAFPHSHNITVVWHERGDWVGTALELAEYRWDMPQTTVDYRHIPAQRPEKKAKRLCRRGFTSLVRLVPKSGDVAKRVSRDAGPRLADMGQRRGTTSLSLDSYAQN